MTQAQYIYCELYFHYSYIAQLVKNHPTEEESQVQFLGWEDPLEKGIASNSSQFQYSCLENSMDRGAWWATVHGVAESQTQLSNQHTTTLPLDKLGKSALNKRHVL